MAAGLGFKTFTTGEVLTAADVNGYLMQGVLVFATEAARDAAITAPQEGQFAFTKDTNSLWYYSGSAWVASGATGDIEGVTAGVGISGGGTSGTVTITNSMATTIDAAGDIIYGTGNDAFTKLSIGTAGQVLKVNSGATAPEWGAAAAGGGMTSLATGTLSSSTVNITSISGSYKNLQLVIRNFDPSTDSAGMFLRFNGDSGANRHYTIATSEASTLNQSFSATSVDLNAGTDNAVTTGLIVIDFPDYANATTWKFCNAYALQVNTTTTTNFNWKALSGFYNQTGAITSITLLPSTGNFAGGDYILYGVN
jgi:hypothetical protein